MLGCIHFAKCLQVVELTGNAGMSGTFGYAPTEANNRDTPLCQTVNGGLRILNMNGLGLDDLALPDCLMGAQSTLEELRLGASFPCPVTETRTVLVKMNGLGLDGLALPDCLVGKQSTLGWACLQPTLL